MEDLCKKCDQILPSDARMCSCGRPTALASFKERTEYEVRQWRLYAAQNRLELSSQT